MMRRHRMLLAAAIAVLAAPVTVTTSASAHTMGDGSTMNDSHRGPGAVVDLIRAAFASAPFLRFENAAGGGYVGKVADKAGITCITDLNVPSAGAMGVHFVNPGLIDLNDDPTVNDTIDASKPEVLVYEPDAAGHYRLVALEYLILQKEWDATHSSPPSLFGHEFMFSDATNRFGLPAYYSLHAWIWKFNPSGTFEMWNPNVHCP